MTAPATATASVTRISDARTARIRAAVADYRTHTAALDTMMRNPDPDYTRDATIQAATRHTEALDDALACLDTLDRADLVVLLSDEWWLTNRLRRNPVSAFTAHRDRVTAEIDATLRRLT